MNVEQSSLHVSNATSLPPVVMLLLYTGSVGGQRTTLASSHDPAFIFSRLIDLTAGMISPENGAPYFLLTSNPTNAPAFR
jgi:hypothetical protein